MSHAFRFLVDAYETERLKTLSVWSQFADADMEFRPESRARTPHEHMVHQCASEETWMKSMLGIELARPALPVPETRLGFLEVYAAASTERRDRLARCPESWFGESARFFGVERSPGSSCAA